MRRFQSAFTRAALSKGRHHHGLATLLAALSAIGPFSTDAYLPSLPEIGRIFNVTPAVAQQTLTAYMVPFAVMTLWHGAISDTLGRRRVTLSSLVLFIFASLGCPLAWARSCFTDSLRAAVRAAGNRKMPELNQPRQREKQISAINLPCCHPPLEEP